MKRHLWASGLALALAVMGASGTAMAAPKSNAARRRTSWQQLFRVQSLANAAQGKARQYRVLGVPAGHDYRRGDWLGLYVSVAAAGEGKLIGYGVIVDFTANTLRLAVETLPKVIEVIEDKALRAGPLPAATQTHIGKALGRLLGPATADTTVQLNIGEHHGVLVDDFYTVRGAVIAGDDPAGRPLGREAVALLRIEAVDRLTARARLHSGKAESLQAGAWVTYFGRNQPPAGPRHTVTVLIVRFSGAEGGRYTDALRSALAEAVLHDNGSGIVVKSLEQPIPPVAADQTEAQQLGKAHEADLVVWGSVSCMDQEACIQPRITIVDPAPLGEVFRAGDARSVPRGKLGHERLEIGRDVLGLAGRLAGLAFYRQEDYATAAYHLGRALRGAVEDAREARVLLFHCYERLGDWDAAMQVAEAMIADGQKTGDKNREAHGWYAKSQIAASRGAAADAQAAAERSRDLCEAIGDTRNAAVTWDKIADIAQARGDLDEALRIRKDIELPVYEKLDDIHARAVTWGKIADIAQVRGDFDEALRIRKDLELPVYEKLEDIRSRTVTWGKIADIAQARGDLDEALRIRKDIELPVYEKLEDIRSRTVTWGKIADIAQARGDLNEALRIRKDIELPVYEKLGDIRARAVTWGKLAGIVQAHGDLDEALRIHKDIELPVYEKLEDIRSRAVTWGKIADIAALRHQYDEAITLYETRVLPVDRQLGTAHDQLIDQAWLAQYYAQRNQPGDRTRAAALLAEARKAAEALRVPQVAWIRRLQEQLGLLPPANP